MSWTGSIQTEKSSQTDENTHTLVTNTPNYSRQSQQPAADAQPRETATENQTKEQRWMWAALTGTCSEQLALCAIWKLQWYRATPISRVRESNDRP